jgi:hypothetical protein
MSGYIQKIPKGMSVENTLKFLQGQIELLNDQLIASKKEIDELKKVVDPEIKTRRLFDLIRGINAHTSAMPDMKGYNTDHDRRYLQRGKNVSVPGIYFEDGGRNLWWIGIEGGDLVIRFDPNLGVGTPDFANGEKLRFHPNND